MMKNPHLQLRFEAFLAFILCLILFHTSNGDWLLFAGLFFIPDLAIIFYLFNPRIGGTMYNISHCFFWPLLLIISGTFFQNKLLLSCAFIYGSHITFDRMLGWGLKYPDSFFNTHLGKRTLFHWGK